MKAIFSMNNIFPFGVSATLLFLFQGGETPRKLSSVAKCYSGSYLKAVGFEFLLWKHSNIARGWIQFGAAPHTHENKCCAKKQTNKIKWNPHTSFQVPISPSSQSGKSERLEVSTWSKLLLKRILCLIGFLIGNYKVHTLSQVYLFYWVYTIVMYIALISM